MENNINITIERYKLPIGSINVFLNGENHKIKLGQKLNIDLPKEGEYKVSVNSFIFEKEEIIVLKNNSTFIIKHLLPMWYYLFGIFIGSILFVLGILNILPVIYITTFVLLFYLPILYYNFVNRKSYFRLQVN